MGRVVMDEAAQQRQGGRAQSRAVCSRCGLREDATIHGPGVNDGPQEWWQHEYESGILTRNRRA